MVQVPANHNDIENVSGMQLTSCEPTQNQGIRYSLPVLDWSSFKYADHVFAQGCKRFGREEHWTQDHRKIDYQDKGVLFLPEKGSLLLFDWSAWGHRYRQSHWWSHAVYRRGERGIKRVSCPRTHTGRIDNRTLSPSSRVSICLWTLKEMPSARSTSISLANLPWVRLEGGRVLHAHLAGKAHCRGHRAVNGTNIRSCQRFWAACSCNRLDSWRTIARTPMRFPSSDRRGLQKPCDFCKMNLAVHGLSGDIREGNSYYEDIHKSLGYFDFVMANPPFNVNKVDKDRIKDDPASVWESQGLTMQLSLDIRFSIRSEWARSGRFVMANSASDCSRLWTRYQKEADREGRSGCDDRNRQQFLLHCHITLHTLVLGSLP